MNEVKITNKKANVQKLLSFGFEEQGESYVYSTDLLNHQMKMLVSISKERTLRTEVIDNNSDDEYVLHLVSLRRVHLSGRSKLSMKLSLKK